MRRTEPYLLTDKDRRVIAGAIAELDLAQLRVLRSQTIAQRVWQAASLIDAMEQVTAHRLRAREPELSPEQALWIVRNGLLDYERQKRNR